MSFTPAPIKKLGFGQGPPTNNRSFDVEGLFSAPPAPKPQQPVGGAGGPKGGVQVNIIHPPPKEPTLAGITRSLLTNFHGASAPGNRTVPATPVKGRKSQRRNRRSRRNTRHHRRS
jgi:hypothetical protein